LCAEKCKEAYGAQIKVGRSDGASAGTCKCYLNAECVAGGVEDPDFDIYTVENPCYWT
jgi:hypothetical protein